MDALERVLQIGRQRPAERWQPDQFRQAAAEGRRRWSEVEELFGIQYPMFRDAVAAIVPDFRMSSPEEQAADSANVPGMRNVGPWIAVSFVRWERCPATAGLPNPYEPWIEIWEHGGAFSVEHGQFVDVYDSEFMPLGCIVVRRA